MATAHIILLSVIIRQSLLSRMCGIKMCVSVLVSVMSIMIMISFFIRKEVPLSNTRQTMSIFLVILLKWNMKHLIRLISLHEVSRRVLPIHSIQIILHNIMTMLLSLLSKVIAKG